VCFFFKSYLAKKFLKLLKLQNHMLTDLDPFVIGGASSRWNFLQGSVSGASGTSARSKSRKLLSRSMQKRIMHHKQRLQDIEAAKSMIEKAKDKVGTPWLFNCHKC
jgi:hypothetical protein